MFSCEFPSDWQSSRRSQSFHHTQSTDNRDADCKQKRRYSKVEDKNGNHKKSKKSSQQDEDSLHVNEIPHSPIQEADSNCDIISPCTLGNVSRFSTTHVTSSTLETANLNESFHVDFAQTKIVPSSNTKIKQLILKQFQHILANKLNDPSKKYLDSGTLQKEEEAFVQQNAQCAMQIDTENLLSKLPYKKMLMDMFGGNLRGQLHMTNIPYVSRAYEEAFMHECTSASERECAKGKMCECMFIDKTQPFVCVEFLLPGEKPSRTPNMCVLCYRAVTQQLYYDVIFDKCEFPGTIQKFGNIHSEVGEYALESMLISTPSAPVHIMPLPIVSHQRNRYQVYSVSGGVKHLRQTKVYFQHTPSCTPDHGL